jgi:hypothetical protein
VIGGNRISGGTSLAPRRATVAALAALVVAGLLSAALHAGGAKGSVQGRTSANDIPADTGYWLAASDGGIFSYGTATFHGSMGGHPLNRPVVGLAPTPSGKGYWEVASDGGIFSFGDAAFFGSTGGVHLNAPIVGMAATPTGKGYWLVASDGGLFAYGDAGFWGSTGGKALPGPVVGMAATPGGTGYWLVGQKGNVYPFGDAPSLGDAAAAKPGAPVVAMAPTPGGRGYWLVAADGGMWTFGDAPAMGTTLGHGLNAPIVGLSATPRGLGYWLLAADGGIFSYGDARFFGSTGGQPLNSPVLAMAPPPIRVAPEVAVFYYPWYANPDDGAGVWRHWNQGGHVPPNDIGSDYYPMRGPYSSADTAVLDSQMAEIAKAGVDTIVSSWWGRGSYEDSVLPKVMAAAAAHGLRVAVHIEPYSGRTPASVGDDIRTLEFQGVHDFWVYDAMGPPAADWANALAGITDVRLFMETGTISAQLSGAFADYVRAAHFDGVYTYAGVFYGGSQWGFACGAARQRGLLCSPSVAPGELDTRTPPTRPFASRVGGARYDLQWLLAAAAGGDIISITSYNEWHEGTQIEPATPYCFPDGYCSNGYVGDFNRSGPSAATGYTDATGVFAARFRATRS